MRHILSLMALFMVLSFCPLGGIYDITLKTIDGDKMELSQFRGKKLLFIVLPSRSEDPGISLSQLGQLHAKYQNSLVIIGIPLMEGDFNLGQTVNHREFNEAIPHMVITESMKAKKGSDQAELFQWLTSKEKNGHFDEDVSGVGNKFFVDEQGELYAVMKSNLNLSNSLMDKILSKKEE